MLQSLNVESLIKNLLSDVEHGRSKRKKETGQTKRREVFVPEKAFFLQIFKVVIEGIVWHVRVPHLFSDWMFDWIRLMMEVTCALDFKENVRGLGL